MNAQIAYAMITQRLPLLKAMSSPVKMLAAKLMAARTSMKAPVMTTMSATKATNRDAKPAQCPCRFSRATIGVLAGVGGVAGPASPARAVMTLPWPLARQGGQAGRYRGGEEFDLPSGP